MFQNCYSAVEKNEASIESECKGYVLSSFASGGEGIFEVTALLIIA